METMKFVMVSTHYPPHHVGGDAVLAKYLCDELVKIGHEVDVFYNPDLYASLRKNSLDEPSEEGVRKHAYMSRLVRTDMLMALGLGAWRKASEQLGELVKTQKPDVVHWHNTKGFIGHPFAFNGIATIYTAHDYYAVCPRSNLLRPDRAICDNPEFCQVCLMRWRKPCQLWRTGKRRVIQFDKRISVISPSEFVASRLEANGIRRPYVIRNFVPEPSHLARNDIEKDTITFLGVMDVHKGPQTLLNAFVRSSHRHQLNLDLVGEGALRESLTNRISRIDVRDRIRVHGFLPRTELETVLDRTAALIVPSEWQENAPLVILEAFSRGIPVIGSNIGGIPEIVGDESGSLLFTAGDEVSLAERIVELWEGRDDHHQMRRKARRFYESRFKPAIHVNKYLEILKEQS